MWRHDQDFKPRVPHLSRLPPVLPPQPKMRVADPGPGALPEDHDQLQPALRPGGPRLQVSAGAALRSATAPPAGRRRRSAPSCPPHSAALGSAGLRAPTRRAPAGPRRCQGAAAGVWSGKTQEGLSGASFGAGSVRVRVCLR